MFCSCRRCDWCYPSLQRWQSQNIQVATRPVEPHRTRLKIAPTGREGEKGRPAALTGTEAFVLGSDDAAASGRRRLCLRCCKVHRFSLFSFQLSLLAGEYSREGGQRKRVYNAVIFANGGRQLVTWKCKRWERIIDVTCRHLCCAFHGI